MTIPNSVGRIDAITEAIREGDKDLARKLLSQENERLKEIEEAAQKEYRKRREARLSVGVYASTILGDDDRWNQARRDCGWKGEE